MKKVLAFLSLLFLFSTITAQQINDTSTLRSVINSQIVPNSNRAITALTLNRILNGYLNTRIIPYSWALQPSKPVYSWSELTAKPILFDGDYNSLINKPVINYDSITSVPTNWLDIIDKPIFNIDNWNTAYSWGNHSGLYRPISYVPSWSEITSKPTFFSGNYSDLIGSPTLNITNWNTAYSWGNHAGLYRPLSYVPAWSEITGKPTLDITNWNTAYSWGNHAGLYRPLSYVPAWSEISGKPNLDITNWNTAYSWGNHAGLYRPITYNPDWTEITGKPILDFANWNTAYSWGNHAGQYKPITYVPAWSEITGKPTINTTDWNTAYSWGNHAGLYRPLSYVPAWSEITSKPSFDFLPLNGTSSMTGTLNGTSLSMSGGGSFGGAVSFLSETKINGNDFALLSSAANSEIAINYNGKSNAPLSIYNGANFGSTPAFKFNPNGASWLNGGDVLINTTTTDGTNNLIVNGGVKFGTGGTATITAAGAATFSSSVTASGIVSTDNSFRINGNGATPSASSLAIGTNGVGTRLLYNVPSGGEHNLNVNGVTAFYATSSGIVTSGTLAVTGAATFSSSVTANSVQINSIVTDGSSKLEVNGNVRNVGNNTASQMVHGSWYPNMSTHSGSITLPATSTTYLYKETSNVTWTLETAYGHNRYYIIRAADIGNVTIALQSGQYIMKKDGSNVTTLTATLSGGAIHLQSDGVSKWYEL